MSDKVSLQNAGGSHRHASLPQYDRSMADLYVTDPDSVFRLYRARPALKERRAWDSSAGLGHIVKAIKDCGGQAFGSDLFDHPFEKVAKITPGIDLFSVDVAPCAVAIVNPPYKHARRHILYMLNLGCEVYALLRVNFIAGKKAAVLLPNLREILLVGRPKMLPPDAEDKGMSPSIDYAWMRFSPEPKPAGDHGMVLERI